MNFDLETQILAAFIQDRGAYDQVQSVVSSTDFSEVGRILFHAPRAHAIFGGLALAALVVMSLISIIGHELWSAPVPGFALLGAAGFSMALFHLRRAAHCLAPVPDGGEQGGADLLPHHPALPIAAALLPWKCISPRK